MENRDCNNCYHVDLCVQSKKKMCKTDEHENFWDPDAEVAEFGKQIIHTVQSAMFNSMRDIYKKMTAAQFEKFIEMNFDKAMEYCKSIMEN